MRYCVKLLFSGNINALNGAANFVRLLDDTKYWEEQQVEFSVRSNDASYLNEQEYRKSATYKVKSLIKDILNKSKVGKRRFIKYEFDTLGKNIVESVKPDEGTCYALNDYMVAYHFYTRYQKRYKTIFLMHNNGDMLSMVDPLMRQDLVTGRFLEEVESIILECANRLVFVSEIAKENFLVSHSEYKDKVVVINIGLKDKQSTVRSKSKNIRLISVGTLDHRKNQIALIHAVEAIHDKRIKLTLVGGGPKLNEWRQYVDSHNLTEKIRLVGAQSNVLEYLNNSDLFVMSSLDEGLPVAAQEAMQAGLPLILTDVGGCRELIDGNGILLENASVDNLKNAIYSLITDNEEMRKMGKRSRKIFDVRFSVNKMLYSYSELFDQLMEDNKNGNVDN